MFNCETVKKWKQSVAWFPSCGVKCIADAERKFLRKQYFYVVMVNCNVPVYYCVM